MASKVETTSEYILSLDLGSNSVGYAAVQTQGWETLEDPSKFGIFLLGSHVFDEAGEDKNGTRTLKNQVKRKFRLGRRTYRRRCNRRNNLYAIFTTLGALPTNEQERDAVLTRHTAQGRCVQPLVLRQLGLDEKLSLEEFAKAICHLNRNRGYLSTRDLMAEGIPDEYRKISQYELESDDDKKDAAKIEQSAVLGGIKAAYEAIKRGEARTYGELMVVNANEGKYTRHYTKRFDKNDKNVKTLQPESKKLIYRSDRALIKEEFHRLFDKQSTFHPMMLTPELRQQLENTIFKQNELTGSEDKRKSCPVYETSLCAPKTSDAFQKSRILQELFNNITVGVKPKKSKDNDPLFAIQNTFTTEQLETLLPDLMDGIDLSIEEIMLRTGLTNKTLTVKKSTGTNKRGFVLGHQTRRVLRELTEGDYANWSSDTKVQVQDIVNCAVWPSKAYKALTKLKALENRMAAKIALAPFPEGYGEYSTKFLNKISDRMIETGEYEATAKEELFKPIREDRLLRLKQEEVNIDPDEEPVKTLIRLPQDLALRNPIVERGIRRAVWVLNQIIYRYGVPEKIRVELPRDLTMSADDKYELEKIISKNEKERARLREELKKFNIEPTYNNVKKARLLDECDGILLYENQRATYSELEELEIDHVYPRSKLYINDNRNLVLCTKSTNATKGNQLVWDFLGDQFAQFQTRVNQCKNMPRGKKGWLCRTEEPGDEWLASQLAATGYIAKALSGILVQLGIKVEITSGKATDLLRRHWGLKNLFPDWLGYAEHLKKGGTEKDFVPNKFSKNRSDHRHHAIDALVIALTDVSTYQRISKAHRDLKPGEKLEWNQTCPIPNLRKFVIDHLDDIVVTSHTVKKVTGELHKQMAQKEDYKKLPEHLKMGAPKTSKVANGKLIRYDRDGKAAQVFPLSNNHHLTIYRSLEIGKKGVYEFKAEITTLIEVARRWRKKEPIYQDSAEMLANNFEKWLTLEKGDIVEFEDKPGNYFRLSSQSLNSSGGPDAYFQNLTIATMDKNLNNATYKNISTILRIRSMTNLSKISRKVQLNAFGEVIHEVNPHENPQFH
jgi:CRISPR-associated endonuclease Csn1